MWRTNRVRFIIVNFNVTLYQDYILKFIYRFNPKIMLNNQTIIDSISKKMKDETDLQVNLIILLFRMNHFKVICHQLTKTLNEDLIFSQIKTNGESRNYQRENVLKSARLFLWTNQISFPFQNM